MSNLDKKLILKTIVLIALMVILRLQFAVAQVVQSGEFIVRETIHNDTVSLIKNCPTFTCVIDTSDISFNTYIDSTVYAIKRFVIDSLNFETNRLQLFNRLKFQKDSIDQSIQYLKILEYVIIKESSFDFKTELLEKLTLENILQRSLLDANKSILNADTLRFIPNTNLKNKVQNILIEFTNVQSTVRPLIERIKTLDTIISNKIKEGKAKSIGGAVIPQISDVFQLSNPAITLLGSTKLNKFGVHTLGIYTGGITGDTLSYTTITVPEVSRYGFFLTGYFDLNRFLHEKLYDKIWINYAINFHEKKTYDLSKNTDFVFTRLQSKIGFEFFIFKDILTFYYNFNWIKPFTNVEAYRSNFNIVGYNQVFNDAGLKIFFQTNSISKNGTGLYTDINLLFLNDSFDRFNPQADFVRPFIKLGLQQNFR